MRSRRALAMATVATVIAVGVPLLPAPVFAMVPVAGVDSVRPVLAPDPTVDEPPTEAAHAPHDADVVHTSRHRDWRSSTADRVEAFRQIGITWRGPLDGVQLRVRRADGTWQGWAAAEPTEDGPDRDAPEADPDAPNDTGPIWVGSSTGWNVAAADGVTDLRVHVVRDRRQQVRVRLDEPMASAAGDGPTIRMRSAWGAKPPKATPTIADGLHVAFVHHTAGSNTYTAGDVPGIIRGIQAYHQDTRGWDDIGYNFLVDKFGRLWEGRAGGITNPVVGAHAGGNNTGSVGISIMGDFSSESFPVAVVDPLAELAAWKLALHGVSPTATTVFNGRSMNTITGHRTVSSTVCPGDSTVDVLDDIRAAAAEAQIFAQPYDSSWKGSVFMAAGDLDGDGWDELVTAPGNGGGPHVKVLTGHGLTKSEFMAFPTSMKAGLRVAVGQFDIATIDPDAPLLDPETEPTEVGAIVAVPGRGGAPTVRILSSTGSILGQFDALDPDHIGGMFVAAGDVTDASPGDEIIVISDLGAPTRVQVFAPDGTLLVAFEPHDPNFGGGGAVTVADLDADGIDEILIGTGQGTANQVKTYSIDSVIVDELDVLQATDVGPTVTPYTSGFKGGMFLTTLSKSTGDVVVVTPRGGGGPHVVVFDGTGALTHQWFAFDRSLRTGARAQGMIVEDNPRPVVVTGQGRPGPGELDARTRWGDHLIR